MKKVTMTGIFVATLLSSGVFAELEINEHLKLEGFLDMSAGIALASEEDSAGMKIDELKDSTWASFDQFELDFKLDFGHKITARVDINSIGGNAVIFEQGYINYAFTEMFSLMTGRFLSSSGFEAAEPTGLFQYSVSKTLVYGYYQNGLALSFAHKYFGLYGALVGSVWDNFDTDITSPGFEVQASITPMEALTVKATFLSDLETYIDGDTIENKSLFNVWAQVKVATLTVAGEFNLLSNWDVQDSGGIGFLAMANYGFLEKAAVTVRYSAIQLEAEGDELNSEITISPSYAVNDNLFALIEFRRDIEDEITTLAVETIFSF